MLITLSSIWSGHVDDNELGNVSKGEFERGFVKIETNVCATKVGDLVLEKLEKRELFEFVLHYKLAFLFFTANRIKRTGIWMQPHLARERNGSSGTLCVHCAWSKAKSFV